MRTIVQWGKMGGAGLLPALLVQSSVVTAHSTASSKTASESHWSPTTTLALFSYSRRKAKYFT